MIKTEITVCIVLEGSYPYITGGVSAWVHDLIINLPKIRFKLFTISPESDQPLRYTLPDNVVEHQNLSLDEYPPSVPIPKKNQEKLFLELQEMHQSLFAGSIPDMKSILSLFGEDYRPYSQSLEHPLGWNLLTQSNQRHNPLYPFSDYFWAWQSGHHILFSVLGARVPEADIYHAVSTGYAGIASLAAKIRHGKPFLLTEHGLYHKEREIEIRKTRLIQGYQRDMWTSIYNKISRICYKNADTIIALFEENRIKQLELGAPEEKTRVIPNGIDIPRFSVPRKSRPGFHVGLVGRVVPIKDIKTFIITAKIICDQIPDSIFYCIGPTDEDPGYYEDCLLLVQSLKLEDRFLFTGRSNVLEYYQFLDVLLLTSVREAQPLVILEAYCAFIPVVATRVGNIPELLDFDERFLASSRDAEKLARGILYIYNHPDEIKEMAQSNLKRVREKYDILLLHRTYEALYRDLAAGVEE